MSTETPETRKISVTFERKVGTGDYGNITARAWVESNVAADATDATISDALSDAFALCKSVVLDELGIEVTIDEAGVIREKNVPAVSTQQQAPSGNTQQQAPSGGFDKKGLEVSGDMTEDIPDWLVTICQANGVDHVWANTGKYGQFYKEFVSKDATPKMGVDSQGRTVIISKPK